ncbi:PIG-L deacetylase family protein [Nocardioides sp. cx-173]|uniref:PIG-L deacetylase family protein n=1 Tax=Nocardioides sp. cx-173 TaxID=2898796 RepID=UPI001E509F60|nr:PIG-L deacetylase family protein [Nocardioides sp. cx-173]MCD4527443.1 PIG-L family deacetylase [Nocardioides sp. cx-173]UGB40995.1 PIG-L family deacetylase [Nocardioides sp. cx-173]
MRAPTTSAEWRSHEHYAQVPELELSSFRRLVVVSAHPDDESLGAGGLIATAYARGIPVYVVLLTAGEASQSSPSPVHTRHALATMRLAEMENALARLAPDSPLVFLGAPDGGVAASEVQVTASLTELLGDASATLVAAPWRRDGHPDHDAAGRAAAAAAAASGATLVEYPVQFWSQGLPAAAPWDEMVRLTLTPEARDAKAAAIQCHASQVGRLPHRAERGPTLTGRVLAHFAGGHEHFVATRPEVPGPLTAPR